jgi:hypothetical protein
LEVYYTDMANNFSLSMDRVLDFLGHDNNLQITPRISKQNTCQMHEIIKNYDSLKNHFADTKWAVFFNKK